MEEEREVLTFSEAMKLIGKHDIKESSDTTPSCESAWVVLKNGWKIEWEISMFGPYSELTPDLDVESHYYLIKSN